MSDEFFIVPFVVRAAGTDVPPEQIQAAINSICQQVTADLNLIVSGGFPQTNVDITGGTITGVTGATQGRLDNSLLLATDAFVNQQGASAVATVPFANVTGGVYNQATLGSGLTVVVFASGGVITSSLTISNPGSGYAVGDLVAVAAGNSDAVLRVTGVSGSGVTSVGIAYGGTGYSTGIVATAMAVPPGRRAVVFTGALTSNLTFIIQNGTYLTASREVEFINNTTGGFTITVFLSNGAGGHTGNGVVLPQGTNDSTALSVYTDGQNDVWLANSPAGIGAAGLASPAFTGTPTAPTAAPGTNTTQLATTAFVATSFAPLASPALTGTPTAPTATGGTSTTQLATTAFVASAITPLAPLASPALTGTPTAPTAAAGTSTTQLATTAFVQGIAPGRLLNVQTITSTQVYTPTAGTNSIIADIIGGGGAGGGAVATSAAQCSVASGGASGSWARSRITSGFSGVTVTIGAAGTGASGAAGSAGGTSSFGGLISAPGGGGGQVSTATATTSAAAANPATAGAAATGGSIINSAGNPSSPAANVLGAASPGVFGASSPFGGGGMFVFNGTGGAASGFGAGGGGNSNNASSSAQTGGAGTKGVCIIYEYA